MKIRYIGTEELHPGCWVVFVNTSNGRTLYHNGPKDCDYFTKEQADKLASRIQSSGIIDLSHWDDGRFYRDDAQRE